MPDEPMFDQNSFLDEIKNKADAESCVDYLASNERNFRKELMEKGLSHEEENEEVKAIWLNLIKSCNRVGYSDNWVKFKTGQYA